jgi:PAS domain S-box-containing protein
MSHSPADPPSGPSAERRLLQHVENTPLAVIEWDRELRVARWNAQAERLFGWTFAEVAGKSPLDWPFVYDADRAVVERLLAEMVAGRQNQNVQANRNYTKGGGVVWCEWHNSVLYDADGKMAWVLSLVLDVTGRRAAADALALSEARVRAALDGAKMLAWDLDLVCGRWHTTVDIADFYGVEPGLDYADPANALRAVHPDDVPGVLAGRQRAVETGEPMRYEFRGRVPSADGRPRWFLTRGQVLRDESDRPVRIVAVTTDITERKRADEERDALNRQLHDAQRWESLGVLAGGIAHDFNNILTIVLGSAGLARRDLPRGSAAAGYLDQIEGACRRAADVCRQMLAYAGRTHGVGARTDLAALVREAAPLLAAAALHAPVRLALAADLSAVQADPAQVRQVLVNLVTNAAEAGGAGEVVVALDPAEVSDGESGEGFQMPPPPGRHVVLTVSDRGPGVTADVSARMFDPFFTTKFAGRGLGLAAVLGIVRAHRGGIRVTSAPGRGTAVAVYWPASAPPAPPPVVPQPPPRATPAAAALVIDDEVFVREVTASILEEMGYAALVAADGPSGLELFAAHHAAVRVAVIDITMPGMTGDAVLAALRQAAPELPAVLISGFTEKGLLGDALGPRTEFVQKPFRPEDLMAAVRRLTSAEC